MPVGSVVRYPAPGLKKVSAPVGDIDERARALAADLVDTMYASPGCVGLAAPQLGVDLRAFAMDVSVMRKAPQGNHGLIVLFDPEVMRAEGEELRREGCLSVPDHTCDVLRAFEVTVRGLTPEGVDRQVTATGFEARALQHELDHLDGLLILDRVASSTAVFRRKRYAHPGEHLR